MTSAPPSPSSATPTASTKPSLPIPILPNSLARSYALIHPCLLLALLALRFEPLVADPINELLSDLPILALLQITHAMICLPPAGSVLAKCSPDADEKPSSPVSPAGNPGMVLKPGKLGYRRRGPKSDSLAYSIFSRVLPATIATLLTTLLATPALATLLVLFGAPLTTHHAETVLCAAHMAFLSSTALIYVHGVEGKVWKEVWGFARAGDAVWGGALGTAVGAWFGAVPVPLDWDRPWQAFPITILVGAYLGYVVGTGLGSTVFFGKRVSFEEDGGVVEGEKKTE